MIIDDGILKENKSDENRDEIYDEIYDTILDGDDGTLEDENESDEISDEMRYNENKNPFEENRILMTTYNLFPLNPWMILWISPLNDKIR
jgi:hypothetical protein